jgi:hypothetical protein
LDRVQHGWRAWLCSKWFNAALTLPPYVVV